MRVARPFVLALFLVLALAPAASAHGDDDEPNHRDTAGRPRGRGHQPHARGGAPGAHGRPRPAAVPADDVVRHADARPTTPPTPPSRPASARSRSSTPTPATRRDRLRTVAGRAADRRLAHRAVPGAADRRPARAALRHGHRVRAAVRRHPGRARCPATATRTSPAPTTQNFDARGRATCPPARRPRTRATSSSSADGLTDPDARPRRQRERLGHRAGPPDDDTRRRRQRHQRRRPDGDDADPARHRRRTPWDWQPTVMLHEITHNLGGVQQSAPHSTPPRHCWDGRDVMCYPDGSSGSQPYTTVLCARRRRDPADLRLRPRRLLQPRPRRRAATSATHWNVYTQRLHGLVRAARDGVRRQHRPHGPGQHRAADRDRLRAARRRR